MPSRRRRKTDFRLRNRPLVLMADLYGRPVALASYRNSGTTVTTGQWDAADRDDAEELHSCLLELRERWQSERARLEHVGVLTPKLLETATKMIARPELSIHALAEEEGVRPQAVHWRINAIRSRWPPFNRVWTLKLSFIRSGKPVHAGNTHR